MFKEYDYNRNKKERKLFLQHAIKTINSDKKIKMERKLVYVKKIIKKIKSIIRKSNESFKKKMYEPNG